MYVGIIKETIRMAEKSSYYPFKIGAVVFKGSRIYGRGYNDIRSFNKIKSKYKKYEHSIHAEQMAIIDAGKNCKGYSIFVIRVNMSGNMRMAFPCEICMNFIHYVGIKTIYYSDKNGFISKIRM